MKLYLNEDCGIDPGAVVGIFDMDTATVAPASREFLKVCERSGVTEITTSEIPVSFIVTAEGDQKVYFTRNAPKVLARRIKTLGLK
jgi:hypothetical protein